jgi:hypothetical protein
VVEVDNLSKGIRRRDKMKGKGRGERRRKRNEGGAVLEEKNQIILRLKEKIAKMA